MTNEPSSPPSWRPWALRTRALLGFIFLCLLLIIAIVGITIGCKDDGCYVFGKSNNGKLPRQSEIVYRQLPTILCVFLSLLWVMPHHDILRLEPYFRMSAESGETGAASLFLEYPYSVAIFVPLKALWNRHYVVSLSASILMLMNFLVLPILGSVFDTTIMIDSPPGNALQSSYISGRNVTANITFSAYERAWYSGNLFPFMTDQYALLPLRPVGFELGWNESWVVETTLFEAEMQCIDALTPTITYVDNSLTMNITSVGGDEVRICDAGALEQGRELANDTACDVFTTFITPWTSMSWELGNTIDTISYMFAWASGLSSPPDITTNFTFPPPSDITAIFCTPSYYSEPVNATIKMSSGEVLNITRSGRRTKMPTLRGFDGILDGNVEANFTGELIDERVPELHRFPVRFGYPLEILANVSRSLLEKFGESSRTIQTVDLGRRSNSNVFMTRTNSLSAFSLYNHTNATLNRLLDGRVLKETYEGALKMVFAFAMAEMVGSYTNSTSLVAVERQLPKPGVEVNLGWALGAIAGLTTIIFLTTLLMVLDKRRPLHLDGEPDSLAASVRLLSASPDLCTAMKWSEYYKQKRLFKKIEDYSFKLKLVNGRPMIEVEDIPAEGLLPDPTERVLQESQLWGLIKSASLASIPVVLVVLIISFVNSRANDGFPMPGGPNTAASKMLYHYLPIAIISSIEPMLVTFSAIFCLVRPYRRLEEPEFPTTFSNSLATNYDKLPAQFQIRNSIRHSEYTLLALSVAILLSNILPITTSGLFPSSPELPKVSRPHNILSNFTSIRQEMYFQLSRSITSDYSPTWTTDAFYIDPPYEVPPNGEVEHPTRGFGMDISCTFVADDRVNFPCSPQYGNGSDPICAGYASSDNVLAIEDACGTGTLPSIAFWDGIAVDSIQIGYGCSERIFPFWVENSRYTFTPPGQADSYQFVVLNCSVADRIMNLRANVNDGDVVSVTEIRPLDEGEIASLYPKDMAPLSLSFTKVLRRSFGEDRNILGNLPMIRINNLIATINNSTVQEPQNQTHLPDRISVVGAFETVLRRLFVNLVRMSAKEILGAEVDQETRHMEKYRVHVDRVNFSVSLVILVYACGVLLVVYFGQEKTLNGHLPSTLFGIYSRLYASNLKGDISRNSMAKLQDIKEGSENLERNYAYGKIDEHYAVCRLSVTSAEIEEDKKAPGVHSTEVDSTELVL